MAEVPAPAAAPPRLPRGRHGLSRAEVAAAQRLRILAGMADAVGEHGFVATSVADVLARAGVSRETFYQLFDSKLDCFMAAFDLAGDVLLARLGTAAGSSGAADASHRADGADRFARFERVLDAYLESIATQPAYARLFLVEVHAAGPEAMQRRAELQERIADALAGLLGADTDAGRFACRMVVAATGALVTGPLVAGDLDALRAFGPPIADHVRRTWDAAST